MPTEAADKYRKAVDEYGETSVAGYRRGLILSCKKPPRKAASTVSLLRLRRKEYRLSDLAKRHCPAGSSDPVPR